MSYIRLSHVTHINKSYIYTYECALSNMYDWVMSRTEMSHVTRMNACDIWMSNVTQTIESCYTYKMVMSHMWSSQVIHVNESSHICEWVMSVSTCQPMCIHIYIFIYIHIYILHIHTSMYTHMYVHIYMYMKNMYMYIKIYVKSYMCQSVPADSQAKYICMYIHIYVYIYMCTYICIYIYIHIYIHIYIYICQSVPADSQGESVPKPHPLAWQRRHEPVCVSIQSCMYEKNDVCVNITMTHRANTIQRPTPLRDCAATNLCVRVCIKLCMCE